MRMSMTIEEVTAILKEHQKKTLNVDKGIEFCFTLWDWVKKELREWTKKR